MGSITDKEVNAVSVVHKGVREVVVRNDVIAAPPLSVSLPPSGIRSGLKKSTPATRVPSITNSSMAF